MPRVLTVGDPLYSNVSCIGERNDERDGTEIYHGEILSCRMKYHHHKMINRAWIFINAYVINAVNDWGHNGGAVEADAIK